MNGKSIKTVYIVGAGFSSYAGLPLTTHFTKALIEARKFASGPSRMIVDFLSRFIRETFDHSTTAGADTWPELEDIFTCVDLSANSGHNLGENFAPSDLRTVRRAILVRIFRMLDQKYGDARKKKSKDWRTLDKFFDGLDAGSVGFISMNWDCVLERKLQNILGGPLIDYGCSAIAAAMPDLPNRDDWHTQVGYEKQLRKPQIVQVGKTLTEEEVEKCIPLIKIHGSINWLYCDNCRRLFWFHPDQTLRIADQLVRKDDLRCIGKVLGKDDAGTKKTISRLDEKPKTLCLCSNQVPLSARLATFSYRKALEFPMFQKSWFAAEEILRTADEWIFIGYSLPPADFEFKYLLKRMQLCRSIRPVIKVVSGGDEDSVARTYWNYYRFFGRGIKKDVTFWGGGLSEYLEQL